MGEISVKIDNEIDETDVIDINNSKLPHNGKPIAKIEVSPNEKYLVTYSREDNSIVGWNVEDKVEGQIELDQPFKLSNKNEDTLHHMCVSDDKKLVYTYGIQNRIQGAMYDMMNDNSKIEVDCGFKNCQYCTFNLKGELILYCYPNPTIYIYSSKTKNNKWKHTKTYWIPVQFIFITISINNKLYLFLNDSIYEWDLDTEKVIKIFDNYKEIKYNNKLELQRYVEKNIKITRNENFACIKTKNKIIIYTIELEIHVASLDINNVTQLNMFIKHPDLCPLLFPLLFPLSNSIQNSEFWEKCLGHLKRSDQLLKNFPQNNIHVTSKNAFIILDGKIRKIDLEKMILNRNSLFKDSNELNYNNSDEIIENWYFDNDFKVNEGSYETDDRLNILLSNPYMYTDIIHVLFQEVISNYVYKDKLEKIQNLTKWVVINTGQDFELQVFKKFDDSSEWSLISSIIEPYQVKIKRLLGIKLINDNTIIILRRYGPHIYHLNENNKSISLIYFYYMDLYSEKILSDIYNRIFSKPTLPSPNRNSYFIDKWVTSIKNNKELILKYGVELLIFAITKHDLELVDDIYKRCIRYFKEEKNNCVFLSIITSTMPLLDEHYPEFISKYSFDTAMVMNSPIYNTRYHKRSSYHLHPFQIEIINLSWWTKYNELMGRLYNNYKKIFWLLYVVQILIIIPFLPIYFATFYILLKYGLVNRSFRTYDALTSLYFYVDNIFSEFKNASVIVFVNPYINFVAYPKDYNWFSELIKPQSSPFVKTTMNKDIYKTWNGESLINFKWDTYGKYYYAIIWTGFMALLVCFTAAATIPQEYIDENVQKQLLITSIILGFIHLTFEIRQIIYDPIKWIRDFWNIFDVIAYVLPIISSIIWLKTNEMNIIPLLSFSCLFLDIKFLLFFRAIEYFGVYFAIMISVAQQIVSFLVVLFIIIISFAHAFYILLIPRSQYSFDERTNNNDPNNPWNLANTYNLIFENGTMDSNPYIIQPPNGNTNMFVNFSTSLFAMYKFLTGDSSALSNWSYADNPSLAILIVLFSLLIVVYLMNLLIGLLNNAIEKDNNRVSYLIQKAEILAEIELFYLFPHQRRWKTWFPEVIYYYTDADKTHEKVKEMIKNDEWDTDDKLKKNLLELLNIEQVVNKPVDEAILRKILEEMKN
ncbi:hypothetical protein RclHR1_00480002 [Rhizophagus clarus]|uniref:Ion transport domain-containing protein n=1 Tax=Rhizophagus clarus TaxID=94130 RepID=A0A2Z6RWI2_9GLOM|nr:hypothetical protein RclHR1_00480002 [Rhizophagus clarus]